MKKVKAVILDIDGTLIDSNDTHAQAFVEAAERLDLPEASFEEVRRMIGMGGDKLIPKAFGVEAESEEGERLDDLKGELFRERLPHLPPTPGARELLERFRQHGLTCVVATSANGQDLKLLLEQAGVADLVEECTSSSDVENSKPDPDIVQVALKQTGQDADSVIMIGDTPYDVAAAQGAGVRIIAVRSGGWNDEELEGAVAVYDDPADLLAHFEESLFAEGGGDASTSNR